MPDERDEAYGFSSDRCLPSVTEILLLLLFLFFSLRKRDLMHLFPLSFYLSSCLLVFHHQSAGDVACTLWPVTVCICMWVFGGRLLTSIEYISSVLLNFNQS